MNKLYFGDNLEILNDKFPGEQGYFDLIYLDPPFNSNRNYNVLFKEGKVDSSAQIHAFADTWEWTDETIRLFSELREVPGPQIIILIESLHSFLGDTPMMAYLVNMTARLIPLRRVLKNTGSIYLHCDPTASHYLKIIMDVIFGVQNFRNEIIWDYEESGLGTINQKSLPSKHDVILWYSKSGKYLYQPQYRDYKPEYKALYKKDKDGRYREKWRYRTDGTGYKVKQYMKEGVPYSDVWKLPSLIGPSKERLGYPTQKPEALLERIIRTSSKEGDLVLDPFCGCGTTVAVAERLERRWVGIDISMQAINVIDQRMRAHYPKIDIEIDGIPKDYEAAVSMADRDKFAFQDWAITLVGASPPTGESKKGADRGIDGIILFREPASFDDKNPKLRKIIVQAKGGGHTRSHISTLKGDIDRDDAPMGIFVCINEPTAEMKREAALAGEYKYSEAVSFPKIQILSVKDYFDGKRAKLPSTKVNLFKTAEAKTDQGSLL